MAKIEALLGKKSFWKKARTLQPGNHAKFWAIDRQAFVLGSYNAIPWNLQEYSFLVEDHEKGGLVDHLYTQYLDELWKYSRLDAYQDPGRDGYDASVINTADSKWPFLQTGKNCTFMLPPPSDAPGDLLPPPPLAPVESGESQAPDVNALFAIPFYGAFDDQACSGLPKGDWQDSCLLLNFDLLTACSTQVWCNATDTGFDPATDVPTGSLTTAVFCAFAKNCDGHLQCFDTEEEYSAGCRANQE